MPLDVMVRLTETLTAELNGYKDVLDLGVGTGRFAEPLQKAKFKVVGIDISRKMICKAQEKRVENLLLADARFIPFKDKSFDFTISIHLLHLITDWRKTLGEICRVTRRAMLSLYYARKDPVRETYWRLFGQYGCERSHPGKAEQDLKDLITPTKLLLGCSYDVHADDRIANLGQRVFSSEWKIPRRLISKVVERLRGEFAGKTFRQDLYFSIWDIDSLKTYVSS